MSIEASAASVMPATSFFVSAMLASLVACAISALTAERVAPSTTPLTDFASTGVICAAKRETISCIRWLFDASSRVSRAAEPTSRVRAEMACFISGLSIALARFASVCGSAMPSAPPFTAAGVAERTRSAGEHPVDRSASASPKKPMPTSATSLRRTASDHVCMGAA